MRKVINWFEIPTLDLDRAMAFYGYCLGAEFRLESAACMTMAVFHYEEPATGGALVYSEALKPSVDGVVVYLFTPDINASLEKVAEKGGSCCFGPLTLPDDIGTIALFIDSEGNKVGLHQPA
ncbi:TPA: VOC family protein [Kluyvera intermedia]|uniref:Glyoxalase n=2 Tax=Enterobacteriaceae TaxID=543 RepID=A0AAC8QR52_9ENTR|nr:VOC family protein [Phytobacter ursingii]HAT2205793.1 VOC family protein [Kluyvera intermedia]AKL13420.1 glyoxalase [Phytobacter ursingii]HAT2516519.1 VOC family protein [Kluyvera intermedia]HAT2604348.1 VOC family protein [Kluyvera intermedia]HAT2681239.1 VOC family protein [Kluyvera intermedia]